MLRSLPRTIKALCISIYWAELLTLIKVGEHLINTIKCFLQNKQTKVGFYILIYV